MGQNQEKLPDFDSRNPHHTGQPLFLRRMKYSSSKSADSDECEKNKEDR